MGYGAYVIKIYETIPDLSIGKQLFEDANNGDICAIIGIGLDIMRLTVVWCDYGWKCFEHIVLADGDNHKLLIILFKDKIKHFNKEMLKIPAKHAGKIWATSTFRQTDGSLQKLDKPVEQAATKCRGTIWRTNDVVGDLQRCFG